MDALDPRVMPEPNTGCWIWLGYIRPTGYPQMGRNTYVHRASYEEHYGPIPKGNHVHHICETRCCVNPHHLRALSPGEHLNETLRINGSDHLWKTRERRWSEAQRGAYKPKTHCIHGHSLEDAYQGARQRMCRECARIHGKDGARRRKEKRAAKRQRAEGDR